MPQSLQDFPHGMWVMTGLKAPEGRAHFASQALHKSVAKRQKGKRSPRGACDPFPDIIHRVGHFPNG
jgi:hypothetical protein